MCELAIHPPPEFRPRLRYWSRVASTLDSHLLLPNEKFQDDQTTAILGTTYVDRYPNSGRLPTRTVCDHSIYLESASSRALESADGAQTLDRRAARSASEEQHDSDGSVFPKAATAAASVHSSGQKGAWAAAAVDRLYTGSTESTRG